MIFFYLLPVFHHLADFSRIDNVELILDHFRRLSDIDPCSRAKPPNCTSGSAGR
jgi:hypothetical protein